MYDRYLQSKSKAAHQRKANYLDVDENCALIKEFNSPCFYLYNLNPTIKIYRIDYDHLYLKFPENFEWYSQKIRVKKVKEGGSFKVKFRTQDRHKITSMQRVLMFVC